jgi:murein DD-endopeptidase MepM/ murein hydrolase activator NlpD
MTAWRRVYKNALWTYRRGSQEAIARFKTFVAWEEGIAAKVAGFVDRFDVAHEKAAVRTQKAVGEGSRRFRFARILIDRRRAQLLKHFTIIVMVAVGVLSLFNYATGYEYSYNGKVLGVVDDQEDVYSVLEVVSAQLSKEHDVDIALGQEGDIQFRKVVTVNRDVDDMEQVLNRLTYMQDINVTAYGIFVDGKRAAVLPTKDEAERVLAGLLDKFSEERSGVRYESVVFMEDVTVQEVNTKLGTIQREAAVTKKLLSGEISEKVHIVAAGDTKTSVSKLYGITVSDLEKDNPQIAGRRLSADERLTIKVEAPLVHVATVEKAVYTVKIAFQTVRKNNPDAYVGINSVKTKGENGQNELTARIVRINGVETNREILKTVVLSEPVTKVVLVGTKPIPPTMGDGHFTNPCPAGRVTSTFGYRWGRMHWGVDLACATGNIIRAADGGTVIFSGWNGSQGYTIKIDHKNGFVTVYAHCSVLYVHSGDKVYEGQTIARVGSTGYSTGPHLHFEVIKNGVHVNPLNYI